MSNTSLTTKQALEVLAQAAAEFKGSRRDHELIEQAVRALQPLVEPKEEPKQAN